MKKVEWLELLKMSLLQSSQNVPPNQRTTSASTLREENSLSYLDLLSQRL